MTRLTLPNNQGRIELVYPPPPSDDPYVHALYTHPTSLKYLPFWSPSQTLESVSERRSIRTAQPEQYRDFRIYHRKDKTGAPGTMPYLVGTVGFLNMDLASNRSAEAGIIISPELHRGGYATEALFLLLDYGFTPRMEEALTTGQDTDIGSTTAEAPPGGLGLHRVTFTTAFPNVSMRRWLEDVLGATQEALLREAWRNGDGWMDAVTYSILETEWHGINGARSKLEKRLLESRR